MARLHVIGERRTRALRWLLGAWALLVLLCARWPRPRSWAIRAGAIGALWAPVVALFPALLSPSPALEYTLIALGCLALGALGDRLLPWPRAPLAPAVVALIALTVDALAGTQLLMRSVLGPDPALGARFYGIGNELKSGLAVLVLAAVAAMLYPVARGCAAPARGYDDGLRGRPAGCHRGLCEDRRGGRRRDPRQRRLCGRERGAARRQADAPARADRARCADRRAGGARRARPRNCARLRALHRQHPARALGRRPARRDRAPLQSGLG